MISLYNKKNCDAVTGFPHRVNFMQSFDIYEYSENRVIIMLLSIDTLETISIEYNSLYNNDLFEEIATRLKTLGKKPVFCRYAYNEFLIISNQINSYIELYAYLNDIIKVCTTPIYILGNEFHVSVNVGISLFPEHSKHLVDVVYKADIALSQSKLKGTNQFHLFTSDSMTSTTRTNKIHIALQKALFNNELYVVFQPKVSAQNDNIIGFETLARWNHPDIGNISPVEFIPIAENTGMIVPIGLFVFEESCKKCKELIKLGYNNLKFSINVSRVQIQDEDIVNDFMSILNKYDISPTYIELEITENIISSVLDTNINTIQMLKEKGFSIALDDFGTGSASFQYLKSLPVDTLKIDKSFISDIGINPKVDHIIQCLIDMSHQLEMSVVAEGVETITHVNFLKNLDCDIFQGYFYSKPIPFNEIIPLL